MSNRFFITSIMGNEHSSHRSRSPSPGVSRGITEPRGSRGNKDLDIQPPPPYQPDPFEELASLIIAAPTSLPSDNSRSGILRSHSAAGTSYGSASLAAPHEIRHQRSFSTSRGSGTLVAAPHVGNHGGNRLSMGAPPTHPTFSHIVITDPAGSTAETTRIAPRRRSTKEDLLEMLKKYNTIIIVDDSSSMAGRRWAETREALAGLADVASHYDLDGIDLHFLNDRRVGRNMKNAQVVKALFNQIDPDGITPIGEKLEELLLAYLLEIEEAQDFDKAAEGRDTLKKIKPTNFIVITDGAPSDDPESVIVTAAKRLDARHFPLSQVGIQFVQIGDDAAATEFLTELDDNLASTHGIRDMVDTTPYTPERGQLSERDIAKILLGGINRRIDKKGAPA